MADKHPRVHPVHDVESPLPPSTAPTAPLVPRGSSRSHSGDPADKNPPPLPFQRTIPYQPIQPPKKRRSCCCRCVCWTLCLLLLLIVAIGAAAGILYLVFKPELPDYSINRMLLTQFSINPDSSLSSTFNVTITAKNPNSKIGIYYEDGSNISAWFRQTKLSEGSIPKFYQGYKNTTVLHIQMTGQTQDANALVTALQEQEQQTGNIPLTVLVDQPVRIRLGTLKLMQVKFSVTCGLLVDSLAANNAIRIQSSSCKFRLRS